jgi:hypothetical protein
MTINIEGDLIFLGRDLKVTLGLSVRGHNIRFPRSVECRSFVLTHSTVHAMPLRMSAQNSIQIDNSKITRFPRHMEAPKICFGRGTLTGFLGRIAGLSGSVKAEIIMVSDRPLKIGRGVIAEKVLFVDENLDCTTMSVGEARSYLGAHKRHARRGVAFTELVRATVRHMPKPFFKFGKGVASGRPIVYDEFHRSAR